MSTRPSKSTVLLIALITVAAVSAFLILETGPNGTPGEVVFRHDRPAKGITLENSIHFADYSNKPSSMLGKTWNGIAT